jgi:hypothetical protein
VLELALFFCSIESLLPRIKEYLSSNFLTELCVRRHKHFSCLVTSTCVLVGSAFYLSETVAAISIVGVDALTADVETNDAERFAVLFKSTGGKPSAQQLQKSYLDGAGQGVKVFTPNRIMDAANMAAAVAKKADDYRYAIDTCLPLAKTMTAELRATYLAYRGVLPDRALPAVHIIFGAGNSGGNASPEVQVIGLEVMCGAGTKPEDFRKRMRAIFAHETVHSWQSQPNKGALRDLLLVYALVEGTPDYLAGLVTGVTPSPERELWGRPREKDLWQQFQRDQATLIARTTDDFSKQPELDKALRRWFNNYGNAPDGWPFEAGYWVGMQIAAAYVAQAKDKRTAINDLIEMKDPAAILRASRYGADWQK